MPLLISHLRLAARLAVREMRAGPAGFGVFLVCLALGVAATASVLCLSRAAMDGLAAEAKTILGADFEMSLSHRPAAPEAVALLAARGELSQAIEARVMAAAAQQGGLPKDGPRPRGLAALAAVDGAYPLYGALKLDPAVSLAEALAFRDGRFGAAAEPALAQRLGIKVGDELTVGEGVFVLRALIAASPARAGGVFSLGPRLLIGLDAAPSTGLTGPGSLVRYVYRVRLARGLDARALKAELRAGPAETGAQMRGADEAAPGMDRLLTRLTSFLSLAGLAAMLTGGLGAALAVTAHLRGRADSIAALKCLGAPGRVVFLTYFLQAMAMALVGTLAGAALGAATPYLLSGVLAKALPAKPVPGFFPGPLALSASLGLLTALAFCLWPLGQIRSVPGLALFRDRVDPPTGRPSPAVLAALGLTACALAACCLAVAGNVAIGLGFLGATAAASAVFAALSRAIVGLARRVAPPKNPAWRHALAGLHRPGNATAKVVFALGLGLTALATTALLQAEFEQRLGDEIPAQAPSYFFLDIRKNQLEAFTELARSVPGLAKIETAPNLRGRITRVKGVPAEQVTVHPDAAWVLRSDRGLTFSGPMPQGAVLAAGSWWPPDYAGPPLASVDEEIARGLGVGVGDSLTVNILGREVTLTVASLRAVKWLSLGINYVLVLSPGVLENAPYSYLATVYFEPGPDRAAAEERLFAAVTEAMPNVTAIPVSEPLGQALAIGESVARAAGAASLLSLIVGALTLAQAFRAGLKEKIYESVVFKVCGATRKDIARILLPEYLLLGLVAGTGAMLLGLTAAWLFTERFLEGGFTLLPLPALAAVAGGAALTTAYGLLAVRRALGRAAWTYLRNE